MKASPQFQTIILSHLQGVATKDSAFQAKLKNPKKNITDCITYILNTVKKSGCNGFADDEIFGMAMHYYDEETIDIGDKINGKVVVNHTDHEGKKVPVPQKVKPVVKPIVKAKPKYEKQKVIISPNQLTMF